MMLVNFFSASPGSVTRSRANLFLKGWWIVADKKWSSKLHGAELWQMLLAHVATPALAEVPVMFRATARANVDKRFADLNPSLQNALELCASHLAAFVVLDFTANALKGVAHTGKLDLPGGTIQLTPPDAKRN